MRIDSNQFQLSASYSKVSLKTQVENKETGEKTDLSFELESASLEYKQSSYSHLALPKNSNAFKSSENTQNVDNLEESANTWQSMLKDSEQKINDFIQKLEEILGVQVEKVSFLKTEELKAQAFESIQDGGEWGADTVANRVLEFAKSISGGDASKIELLKDSVNKAFEKVGGLLKTNLNEDLPDVSKRTYDLIMEGFDKWEKEAKDVIETTEELEA